MLLQKGRDAYLATGAAIWATYHATLLADALEQDGEFEEALSLLDDEIATASKTGVLSSAAEMCLGRGGCFHKTPRKFPPKQRPRTPT